MKFRYSIAVRINLAFGIIIAAVVLNAFILRNSFVGYRTENLVLTRVLDPCLSKLMLLHQSLNEAELLSESCLQPSNTDSLNRVALTLLMQDEIPRLLRESAVYQDELDSLDQPVFLSVSRAIQDTLLGQFGKVLERSSATSSNRFDNTELSAVLINREIELITEGIIERLSGLIGRVEKQMTQTQARMEGASAQFDRNMKIMTLGLVFLALLIALGTTGALVRPIRAMRGTLTKMSQGMLPREKVKESHDEIGDMSVALNSLVKSLREISEFSVEIGKRNFDNDFKPLSEEDVLGNSLINMRDELRKAAEEEDKRKKEDDQRNWATLGLAKFGEILRQNNNSIEEFAYTIISNLVEYTSSNQGGMFLINNNDPRHVFLELVACYAYNRRKFLEKSIELGEGLVGRCVLERAPIYLTEIPDNYIRINSGLGDSNPRSLLIVPLMVNEEIFGVIEMASFEEIEKYKMEFVEKIGESIASTISTVKFNIQTAQLLDQSRQQAEQMASQEEEMRQNMEELRATQEQSDRRELELQRQLDELKDRYNNLLKSQG